MESEKVKGLREKVSKIQENMEKKQKELEKQIEEKRAGIEKLKSGNEELQEEEKAITAEILKNKGIMNLKKATPSSIVYKSAKEENEQLLRSKRAKLLQIKINNKQIKELEDEIEGLEKAKESNEEFNEIEKEAEKVLEEAKNKIDENKDKIEALKSKNEKLQEEQKAITAEILKNEGIMNLKKATPSSIVYKSAKEENKKLLDFKRGKSSQITKNTKRIESLETEIKKLEDEMVDLDDLLSEIRAIKSEQQIKQQEDEMWEQYRLEQEKTEKEQERRKQEEIDKAFDEKEFEEQSEEKIRDLLAYEDTQKWLNGDELIETPTTKPAQRPVSTTRTTNTVQTPTSTTPTAKPVQRPATTRTTNQVQSPASTATVTKPEPEVKPEDKDKCEIKQAGFRIQANGNPEYYVLFMKDGKLDIKYYEALPYINTTKRREFYKLKDVKKRIKYFDFGLEEILEDFDFTNKTNYVDQYINSIMKNDAKVEDRGFQLSYDFSNLSIYSPKNSQKLRYLRNIAKADKEAGLAEYYKPKNIFKRIESRIKNSKFYSKYFLPVPVEYETVKEPTNEQIKHSFEQLYDEPGFDIEVFAKQNNFSDKTASEYKALQGKKGKEFRESLKAITETKITDPDFEDISKTVEEVKKEQGDKKEKSGWEI